MDPSYTDITFLVDRSGSMYAIRADMVGAMNAFLDGQRPLPGRAAFTLATFDTEYKVERLAVPLAGMPPLTLNDLVPMGGTALLDAMARGIRETGERLAAMPEAARPGKVLFVVITDGEENESKEHTAASVKAMTDLQAGTYSWEFIYLGANQDAFAVAHTLGIPAGNTLNYQPSAPGVMLASSQLTSGGIAFRAAGYTKGTYFVGDDQADESADEQKTLAGASA